MVYVTILSIEKLCIYDKIDIRNITGWRDISIITKIFKILTKHLMYRWAFGSKMSDFLMNTFFYDFVINVDVNILSINTSTW